MLISLLERSDSPFLLRGDSTWLFPLKMSSISEILQGKGRESEKFHFSLSLPSFEQYFPRGSFTSSAFGITGLDLSSPLASSEFDSKLVVVVRLWRISRGMNHLFQEIINIINITTLSLPLTYILINILLTPFDAFISKYQVGFRRVSGLEMRKWERNQCWTEMMNRNGIRRYL